LEIADRGQLQMGGNDPEHKVIAPLGRQQPADAPF
jgi:hypothetical protein